MRMDVTNHQLAVGSIELTGVASASLLQVGDSGDVCLQSMFDTPPESVIVGPLAPLGEPVEVSTGPGTEVEEPAP
ncbi:spore gernimation protein GerPD [Paenibacillus sp. IB182496]|uniref:Spore gernimation protein GerPD n=1 Tax=Paenibacillus sabuli TaxID=2772509 RepID=A0A927BUV4_9BACL|nr:spore gernimation protein GerPD [Paenibacillus sabuli]MBD2847258.1 spore gernimation protein GerPD [Paenibacillus sabuli]